VIIDLFETGDIAQLAPFGWQRGRRIPMDPFACKWFEMVPGDERLWEWVTPKAGILVHNVGGPPTKATGENLFGTHTWKRQWKHGYEPMATLDRNSDGLLTGSELADIWVWVDANSDAKLTSEEVASSKSYLSALSVRPLVATDAYCSKGASLNSGTWVGSWDWWSNSPGNSSRGQVVPLRPDRKPVTLYRWVQTTPLLPGQKSLYGGYFLFGDVYGELVIAAISSRLPCNMRGSSVHVTRTDTDGLYWSFDKAKVGNMAKLLPSGDLQGKTVQVTGDSTPVGYAWSAVPVRNHADHFSSSLAFLDMESSAFLDGVSKGEFHYEPVLKEDAPPLEFNPLDVLMNALDIPIRVSEK
jgi:hypothetical protein